MELTDADDVTRLVTGIGERHRRIDVLHFNPSAFRQVDALHLTTAQLFEDLAVGVAPVLPAVQAAKPFMPAGAEACSASHSIAYGPQRPRANPSIHPARAGEVGVDEGGQSRAGPAPASVGQDYRTDRPESRRSRAPAPVPAPAATGNGGDRPVRRGPGCGDFQLGGHLVAVGRGTRAPGLILLDRHLPSVARFLPRGRAVSSVLNASRGPARPVRQVVDHLRSDGPWRGVSPAEFGK